MYRTVRFSRADLVGLSLDTVSPVESLIQLLMVRVLTGKVNLELDRGQGLEEAGSRFPDL